MKNLFSIALPLYMMVLGFSCTNRQTKENNHLVASTVFAEKIKTLANAQILDVRTEVEFKEGHIKNAINYDWYGSDFDHQIANLDKEKPVLFYCLSGNRSAAVSQKLLNLGFEELYELEGGMMMWRANKLPEEL